MDVSNRQTLPCHNTSESGWTQTRMVQRPFATGNQLVRKEDSCLVKELLDFVVP